MAATQWWAGLAGAALVFSCAQLQSHAGGRAAVECTAPRIDDGSTRLGDGAGHAFFMLEGQDLERSLAGHVYRSNAVLEDLSGTGLEPAILMLGLVTIGLVALRAQPSKADTRLT